MEDELNQSHPNHRVLVLNRLWQAVNVIDIKRAFALLFQEHARVIHSDSEQFLIFDASEWIAYSLENPAPKPEDCIHTIRLAIRIPRILLLTFYDQLPVQEVKFNRQNLFERDGYTCQYCGQSFASRELNLDHVIPRDRGGQTTWENIATSCKRCNARKANRLPHEAGMRLLRKPTRPPWKPFVTFASGAAIDSSWTHFLHVSQNAP